MPLGFLVGLLVVLAPCVRASFPSLGQAQDACVVTNTSYGTCQPYPSTGICARFFPNNQSVYVPQGFSLQDIEQDITAYIQTADSQATALGPACNAMADEFTCLTRLYPCVETDKANESIPVLPCAQFCKDYWTICYDAQKLDFLHGFNGDYAVSEVPNCLLNATFDSSYAIPQPPDVWGGRKIAGWIPTINGLLGEVLMPIDFYNYTFVNQTVVQMQCYQPPASSASDPPYRAPPVVCPFPLVTDANNITCDLNCPFPVFSDADQYSIQAAYVAPAIPGFILCLLVLIDSAILIRRHYGCRRLRDVWLRSQKKSSSNLSSDRPTSAPSGSRAVQRRLSRSTVYALLGSCLGLIYFIIGPLPTLMYGSSVSCPASSTINFVAVAQGTEAADPLVCLAQRGAPFVLQAIFNLILYSLAHVFFSIDARFKRLPERVRSLVVFVLRFYCAALPVVTIIIAYSLDNLPDDVSGASIQLSRQSTVCQLRLSLVQEWMLIFVPFIFTGCLVCVFNFVIFSQVNQVVTATAGIKVANTASDIALHQLMLRLGTLGLASFATLCIVIVSASVYSAQLSKFAPPYATYFMCIIQRLTCVDCDLWFNLAQPPSPGSLAVQLFAESCIVLLFGAFFAAQSASRILRERRTAMQRSAKVSEERQPDTLVNSTFVQDVPSSSGGAGGAGGGYREAPVPAAYAE